jgi:hypothetical protein
MNSLFEDFILFTWDGYHPYNSTWVQAMNTPAFYTMVLTATIIFFILQQAAAYCAG